jgi:hypothetical protein
MPTYGQKDVRVFSKPGISISKGEFSFLPRVGPFASGNIYDALFLPTTTISSKTTWKNTNSESLAPFKAAVFNISQVLSADMTSTSGLFLWVNSLILSGSATFDVAGKSNSSRMGGNGGSGGGSGGLGSSSGLLYGGAGGSGDDGEAVGPIIIGTQQGLGTETVGLSPFSFPIGGSGGKGKDSVSAAGGAAGKGGSGFGGGGGGGGTTLSVNGQGGGAGAGNICIVANSISGAGTLDARGGNAIGATNPSGGGGGGSIYIAAKKYTGQLTALVSGGTSSNEAGKVGTASIWEISRDGLTLTPRLFTNTWDNFS